MIPLFTGYGITKRLKIPEFLMIVDLVDYVVDCKIMVELKIVVVVVILCHDHAVLVD